MTKINGMMWVHQNKKPVDSGGVQIGAKEMSRPNQVPLRWGPSMDRSESDPGQSKKR